MDQTIVEIRKENLQLLIKAVGKKSELAHLAQTDPAYISQVLSEKTNRNIGDSLARKLETACKKPRGWLDKTHDEVSTPKPPAYENTRTTPDIIRKIPLLSWISAGIWCGVIDNFFPGDAEEWLPCPVNCGHNSFALRVSGDSMTSAIPGAKTYPNGCIIFIDPGRQPTSGCSVVAKLKDHEEATFKTYREDMGKKWLIPINRDYEKLLIDSNIIICGVVVGKFEAE